MLKTAIVVASITLLTACGGPGTAKWCEEKKAQSKSSWTMDDAKVFAEHCLIESNTVGSEAWCDKMKDKGKDDLSVEEAANMAKHCII